MIDFKVILFGLTIMTWQKFWSVIYMRVGW